MRRVARAVLVIPIWTLAGVGIVLVAVGVLVCGIADELDRASCAKVR